MLLTEQQIKQAAEIKGWRFEVEPEYWDRERRKYYPRKVGIEKGHGVYYWFNILTDGTAIFEQRYSMNVGTCKRGVTIGIQQEKRIQQILNLR